MPDSEPYGTFAPGPVDRAILSATRKMPDTWLGLRLAILLRRVTLTRLKPHAPVDTDLFGLRVRLHPLGNGCEKGALFTPQMYEVPERAFLSDAIARARADGRRFTFVDVGANVGLFSFLVASLSGNDASILAIEPEPTVRARLAYNLSLNPGIDLRLIAVAVADKDGELVLHIDERDIGGSRLGGRGSEGRTERVRTRRLSDVLSEEGFEGADALKIDIEGLEDVVLRAYLDDARDDQLPKALILEDSSQVWSIDLFGVLAARGYREAGRGHQNVFLRRDGD